MTVRHLLRGFSQLTLQIALLITPNQPVVADEVQTPLRLRPQSPKIADAIAQGIQRSPAFRRLVESIDATDGLVFVTEGTCRRGARACLEMTVTIAGPNRILHIFVNPRRAPGCQLIEVIGHELQHAVEVLSNPAVRSRAAMVNFYDRIGRTGFVEWFETAAAVRIGRNVAGEACRN